MKHGPVIWGEFRSHRRKMRKFINLSLVGVIFSLSLGVATLAGGCGGEEVHPMIKEGVSPYDKAKESMDATKAEYMKRMGKSQRSRR
jgi:hypothetical protein